METQCSSDSSKHPLLLDASSDGDVEFLRKCVQSKEPNEYYLVENEYQENMLHIAVQNGNEEFIREAKELLPLDTFKKLLQKRNSYSKSNPLNDAAVYGNLEIVKLLTDVCRDLQTNNLPIEERPWLVKDSYGETPCHSAISTGYSDCGLELFKLDTELILDMKNNYGKSLLDSALENDSDDFVIGILKSPHIVPGLLNLVVQKKDEEFINKVKTKLPFETLRILLQQQSGQDKNNPLHEAAKNGNFEIVKKLMEVCKGLPTILPTESRPWLMKNINGETPCHCAISNKNEECALELLKLDMELLLNITKNDEESLLYSAISNGLNDVALNILKSPHPLSGLLNKNPLRALANAKDGEAICRKLLEIEHALFDEIDDRRFTVLHTWADQSKLWAFKCVLNSNDIIPNIKTIFVGLMSKSDNDGSNPLHILAKKDGFKEEDDVEIAKLIIETCKQEPSNSSTSKDVTLPWMMQDDYNKFTPLNYATREGKERLAMYIMSMDENALSYCSPSPLLAAIENRCCEVAQHILNKVEEKGLTKLLYNEYRQNALHLAPCCQRQFQPKQEEVLTKNLLLKAESFVEKVLEKHPNLLEVRDKYQNTVFHKWVQIGEVWPFAYIFKTAETNQKRKNVLEKLISFCNRNSDSLIHVLATTSHNEDIKLKIAEIIVEAYQKKPCDDWMVHSLNAPWFKKNCSRNYDAVQLAIYYDNEELGLYILKRHAVVSEVLDKSEKKHETLFLAMNKNCYKIAEYILDNLNKKSWSDYLVDSSNDQNVLHLVPPCKDESFGEKLVKKGSEFINKPDKEGNRPIDKACEAGATWMVKAVLKIDPSLVLTDGPPLPWIKACKEEHISVIYALINEYGSEFRNHCIEQKDTPLHHLKLSKQEDYKNLLKTECMNALINVKDSKGDTPLHKAIQNDDTCLVETLLATKDIKYNTRNKNGETAADLLKRDRSKWSKIFKRITYDPTIKTSYFEHKTNLLDVRNSLMVVAALLTTITFTAGFTLPGGLNQDGEAMLAKKKAFLVFLLSDTLAMCSSMLVLVCLVWSMVHESSTSLPLIDRSMPILILSLYLTLLAFMTGVCVVISPKSLWAAITIIVFCCVMGIAVDRTFLYKVLFIPIDDETYDQIGLIQLLKLCKRKREKIKDLEKQN